jgi:hypothetical protein
MSAPCFFFQRGAIRGRSPINYEDDNIRVFLAVDREVEISRMKATPT